MVYQILVVIGILSHHARSYILLQLPCVAPRYQRGDEFLSSHRTHSLALGSLHSLQPFFTGHAPVPGGIPLLPNTTDLPTFVLACVYNACPILYSLQIL